jgi:hypothetical protein
VTPVDTNVLLDLVTDDRDWAEWSIEQLQAASLRGPLLINDVVYAELSVRYTAGSRFPAAARPRLEP